MSILKIDRQHLSIGINTKKNAKSKKNTHDRNTPRNSLPTMAVAIVLATCHATSPSITAAIAFARVHVAPSYMQNDKTYQQHSAIEII